MSFWFFLLFFYHKNMPHHVNAVNIAKSLLKTNVLDDFDLTQAPERTSCTLQKMALEIINTQVSQIQVMERMLGNMGIPPKDDCTVLMDYTKDMENNQKPTKAMNKCPLEVHDTCPKECRTNYDSFNRQTSKCGCCESPTKLWVCRKYCYPNCRMDARLSSHTP